MSTATMSKLREELAAVRRRVERLEGTGAAMRGSPTGGSLAAMIRSKYDGMSAGELEARASAWEERIRQRVESHPTPPFWQAMQERLERKLGRVPYWAWFASNRLVADEGDVLTIEVLSELAVRWIPLRYSDVLTEALKDVGRPGTVVRLVARP